MKKSNKPLPVTKGFQLDGKGIFTPYKPKKTSNNGGKKEKK